MTSTTATSEVAYSHSPEANLVLEAAGRLDGRLDPIQVAPGIVLLPQIAKPLAELLQNIGDAMHDAHAEEVEHPDRPPAHRWQVHPGWDRDPLAAREDWTDALRLARALLRHPDPNAA